MLIAGALAFSSQAQALGQAEVLEPSSKYQGNIYNVSISWGQDVEMVNPMTDDYGNQYIPVKVNASGYESVANFSYKKEYDYETWEEVENKSVLTASVYSNLMDPDTYEPIYGDVTFTINEGVVRNAAGETNAAQTIEFVIMRESYSNYSVFPENYATANPSTLKETTLTFDGMITPTEPQGDIKVTENYNTTSVLPKDCVTFTDNAIILDLSSLAEGYNEIIIPSGFVIIEDESGENTINGSIYLNYTVWDGMSSGKVLNPEGFNVTTLDVPVQVTWNCPVTLQEGVRPTLYCYAMEMYNEPVPSDAIYLEGEILNIDLSYLASEVPSGSNIEVTLPVGIVVGDEGRNPVQNITFYYYKPYSNDAYYDMENGIITIGWAGVSSIGSPYSKDLYIINPDSSVTELTWSSYGSEGEVRIPDGEALNAYLEVEIDLNLLDLPSGSYTLVVPEGAVFLYMADYTVYCNAASEYKFTRTDGEWTGVKTAEAEADGIYRVFNLQGVGIMTTRDSEALKTLPKGIYIVNGRKIMVS